MTFRQVLPFSPLLTTPSPEPPATTASPDAAPRRARGNANGREPGTPARPAVAHARAARTSADTLPKGINTLPNTYRNG